MALKIETFNNKTGGFSAFKAIGHPLVMKKAVALINQLAESGPIAIFDPQGLANAFAEVHDCSRLQVNGYYIQDVEMMGTKVFGQEAQAITKLSPSMADTIFVVTFDAARVIENISHIIGSNAKIFSLDDMRLDDAMLTNRRRYLDPINFATNFAFFRDTGTKHTRLVSANYWAGYGAKNIKIWCRLFGSKGDVLADWEHSLDDKVSTIVIDSEEIRRRFELGDFTGQLFIHVVGAAGHDVVKYALDTYGNDETVLSCTHDANAWPSDLYGGLPAPRLGEKVVLWVQNSHPCPIKKGAIGLNRMGDKNIVWLDKEIPAFASLPLDISSLLPDVKWPAQIEINAGKHFVRPRYEITTAQGRSRISHPNVERSDLKTDARIPELNTHLGKGYLLPAPILPFERFKTTILPTPMATNQENLPVAAVAYDHQGNEIARHRFGCLKRNHEEYLDADLWLGSNQQHCLKAGYGHVELVYDFSDGGEADGWLHGLFRYEDRHNGHAAETSFGAHIFNSILTYKDEPQSYAGPPPGLSTRLFLRTGRKPQEALCHLIYPASTPWHEFSRTELILHNRNGQIIATENITIPCGGSLHFRHSEKFDIASITKAGDDSYVLIRDTTCRLFGYHGLSDRENSFSLDHMFGF